MRPLILDPQVLRRTARDLDTAGADTASALGAVEPPSTGYAWRRLVDKGVTELLDDAQRVARDCRRIGEALEESDACPLLLEDTAGAGKTLGRSFDELARLIELGGGHERLGLCLDSCHLLASGYDVRTADAVATVMDECVSVVGRERLRCLHVNDSQTPLGSNRDRHAPLGEGEIGARGCGAFLSEPRFEGLPAIFEGPGLEGKAPAAADIERARKLRANGLRARARRRRG